MSWLHGGLGRLLHSSKGEPTAESSQPGPKLPAQAGKPKGDSGLMTKQPSPRSWADAGSQAPDTQRGPVQDTAACSLRRTSETQQLLDGPGSVYALLPCIKQLRPSRNAADQLAAAVLGALPGVKLDSSWMVYPAGPRSGAKKTEGCICILPDLQPPGYFCSTAAVIEFLRALQDSGAPLPGVLQPSQPPTSPASAQRYIAAVTAALLTCGPAFKFLEAADSVRDSTGSGDTDMAADDGVELNQQQHAGVKKRVREPQKQQQEQEDNAQQDVLDTAGAQDAGHQQEERAPKRSRVAPADNSLDRDSSGAAAGQEPDVVDAAVADTAAPEGAAAGAADSARSGGGGCVTEAAADAAAAEGSPRDVDITGAADSQPAAAAAAARGEQAEAAEVQRAHAAAAALRQTLGSPPRWQLQPGTYHMGGGSLQGQGFGAAGQASGAGSAQASPDAAENTAAATGAGRDVAAGAAAAAAGGGPSSSAAAAEAAAAAGGLISRLGDRAGSVGAAAASDSTGQVEMPDWQVLHRLQSLRSADAFITGRQKLNRVDAKLESIRRAALVLGRVPSMSPEMAAPKAPKPPKMPSPVSAAAALAKPYAVDCKPRLPPKPRPSSSGGGGSSGGSRKVPATNTFTAASDVKAMSKLDSLLRAKEAAAAIKAAVQSGLPYEGTLEQRHHAMRQQLKQQLPDGRVPCAEGLAVLQEVLSVQLPGVRLDSEWLVYPATPGDAIPKLDILVKHPRLAIGYFRSYRSVATFYSNLCELLRGPRGGGSSYYSSRDLVVPGLSLLPDELQQQDRQGRSPGELQSLMIKAASKVGRSFVKDVSGGGAAAAAAEERGTSPVGSEGPVYPAGGAKAAAANAAAVASRRWQPPPLVANLPPPRKGSPVLVLGMFYASEATAMESHNGLAQYRDRIRLHALHKQVGYVPHSFDRDHEVELAETDVAEDGTSFALHVQGNFNSKRGAAAVSDRFPDKRFTAVLLDYFRMPSGYAGDIYKSQLFLDYIPELVRRGNLPAGVPIYIPNSPVLLDQLATAGAFVDYGDVVAIPARCYPLYEATRHAETSGQMPAKYSNAGQVRELVPGAEFIVVHYCGDATPAS